MRVRSLEASSPAMNLAATIGASRDYPALRTLAPARPAHAKTCLHCEEFRVSPGSAEGCTMCWYGWENFATVVVVDFARKKTTDSGHDP
jgi:hypothetical protein